MEPNGVTQPYSKAKVSEYKEGTCLPRPDLYGLEAGIPITEYFSKDNDPDPISHLQELQPIDQIRTTECSLSEQPIKVDPYTSITTTLTKCSTQGDEGQLKTYGRL